MKLKTRGQIASVLAVCVFLSCGGAMIYLDHILGQLNRETNAANEVITKIATLRTLTADNVIYPTDRGQKQWTAIYDELDRLLNQENYKVLLREHDLGDTAAKLKNLSLSFHKLLSLPESPGPHNPQAEVKTELRYQVSAQLQLAAEELVTRFTGLGQEVNAKLLRTQRWVAYLDMLAVMVLAVLVLSANIIFRRGVMRPILKLEAGAAAVGAGDLDYRIGLSSRDEIGTLSRAFDEMTANLRQTVRRLEEEVAERQRAEGVIKTSHHFLQMMNRHTKMPALLHDFVAEVKNLTQCEAVGIRILDKAGNIPYESYEGFSQEFYEMESPLVIHSDKCMCINVIKGTTDPNLPFYTPGGSFYMNATTRFLATVSEEDKGQTRNVCNATGYESVALVPIRLGELILGLIHLADPREDMVPLEKVELLEFVALQLGPALKRIRAQETLDLERQRLFSVLESIPAYVALISPDCKLPFVNREFIRRFGDPEDRLCHEFLFGLEAPCEDCKALPVFETNAPEIWEWAGADGNIYQVHDYPFTDIDGSPLVLEMGVDITARKRAEAEILRLNTDLERRVRERTEELERSRDKLVHEIEERKRAEEALQENQERLRIAQQAAQWGVFDFNYATGENYWSPEIQMLYGIPPGTFEGTYEGWRKRVHPEDLERVERANDRALETGEYAEDFRIVWPDGSVHWLFVRGKIFRDAEGRPLRMLGVNVDITGRKQAEAEIERLASFPRLNPSPVLEVDFAGNITYSNPATLEVLKQLDLQGDVSIFLPEDMATILKEVKETGKNQIYREVEIGNSIFALIIFLPADLNVVRIYSIDITELKRAEESLSRLNEELEHRVEERTADLERASESLRQSEQRLRYLASQILTAQERERKRIAMELHEGLGQSMTALKMYLRAIQRRLPRETVGIEKDFDSAQNLLREMIEEVRHISRGLSPALLETLGLTAAIKRLLDELSGYQEVTLSVDIDDIQNLFSPQTETNLFRIFQESLNNIAKHAQATQVSVAITRQDGKVNFLIKDNGVGFDQEQIAHAAIADQGMGLAAMEERLRMIGAHLNIVSQTGMGTEINFSIPCEAHNRKGIQ